MYQVTGETLHKSTPQSFSLSLPQDGTVNNRLPSNAKQGLGQFFLYLIYQTLVKLKSGEMRLEDLSNYLGTHECAKCSSVFYQRIQRCSGLLINRVIIYSA